jgi:hypothetical protein
MHWDYAAGLPYLDAQVSKYVDRHQAKGGFDDLLKALSYLEKTMLHYYPQQYARWKGDPTVDTQIMMGFDSWTPPGEVAFYEDIDNYIPETDPSERNPLNVTMLDTDIYANTTQDSLAPDPAVNYEDAIRGVIQSDHLAENEG